MSAQHFIRYFKSYHSNVKFKQGDSIVKKRQQCIYHKFRGSFWLSRSIRHLLLSAHTCSLSPEPCYVSHRKIKFESPSHVRLFADPMDCSPPGSSAHGDSPLENTGVGSHALLEGIYWTQGSKPSLLHCRQILYHLYREGSPTTPTEGK